jgi:hypothetical protein
MPEVFSWAEGQIALWTGSATASATVGLATDITLSFAQEYINRRTLSGNYYNLESDRRVDISFGHYMTTDLTILKIFKSATGVHFKINHSAYPNGSAGFFIYSGVLNNVTLVGSDGGVFSYSVRGYANEWSAYG